jgi:hypothetical protein
LSSFRAISGVEHPEDAEAASKSFCAAAPIVAGSAGAVVVPTSAPSFMCQ